MLHTNLQGNRSTGSGEDDFEGFLPYIGVTSIMFINIHFLVPESLSKKFG